MINHMIFNSMANLWSGSNGINILPSGGGNSKSPIKSIQRGTVSISSRNNTSKNVNINKVDTNSSIVRLTYRPNDSSIYIQSFPHYKLYSDYITITTRYYGNYMNIRWEVIEFNKDFIKSFQYGTLISEYKQTIMNVNINSIDIDKSLLFVVNSNNDYQGTYSKYLYNHFLMSFIKDNNTLQFESLYGNIYIINWQVIEFI